MFKQLHAMANAATLLITASAEGDQLRVSVTPTYPDGKVPAGASPLRPLSVIATPEELDADFAAVLAFWQAPKRSLIEQAQAAAGDGDEGASRKAASKPAEAKAPAAQPKSKPGRKTKADAATGSGADDEVKGDSDAETFALSGAGTTSGAAPAAEPVAEPAPDAAPVDTFTIDLF